MKIGILSDTHGAVERTVNACGKLLEQGVEQVFHCGDLGSESILIELSTAFLPKAVPVHAVLGNVDLYNDTLLHFPPESGVQMHGRTAEVELDNKRLGVVHGDDPRLFRTMLEADQLDYLFTGHTHEPSDTRAGRCRIINPGAVYRAAAPSIAVLDLAQDALTRIAL